MLKMTGKSVFLSVILLLLVLSTVYPAVAAEQNSTVKWGGLQGLPVNIAISGGGSLPEGVALTVYNVSYRDKQSSVDGDDPKPTADATQFIHTVKLRYGITNHFEINSVIPYVMMDPEGSNDLDSFGDVFVGATYAFLLQREGDPVSLSTNAGLYLPSGSVGSEYLPGGGAWGSRLQLGLTKVFDRHRVDFDLIGVMPFTDGNKDYTKGNSLSFNYKYAYLLNDRVDIGIEGTIDRTWNGEMNDASVNNHALEWYTGPTINVAIPALNSWVGLGAYFPVYRDYGQDTSTEDCRIDFKFGIAW